MLCYIPFSIVCLLLMFDKCVCEEHIYGVKKGLDFYTNEVLNTTEAVPKKITIIFEYIGSRTSPLIDYCKITTNVNSTANFTLVDRENKIIKATVIIPNATNVVVSIELSGEAAEFEHSLQFVRTFHEHVSKNAPSKSLTMVFVRNATLVADAKPHSQSAIGTRQHGDELLYFESRTVRNASRFPSRSFEYAGGDRTRITYVGFSFNSPTAVAFIDSTFVQRQEFSAIAYDMNADHFTANVSIYGFRDLRPNATYKEIFELKEKISEKREKHRKSNHKFAHFLDKPGANKHCVEIDKTIYARNSSISCANVISVTCSEPPNIDAIIEEIFGSCYTKINEVLNEKQRSPKRVGVALFFIPISLRNEVFNSH